MHTSKATIPVSPSLDTNQFGSYNSKGQQIVTSGVPITVRPFAVTITSGHAICDNLAGQVVHGRPCSGGRLVCNANLAQQQMDHFFERGQQHARNPNCRAHGKGPVQGLQEQALRLTAQQPYWDSDDEEEANYILSRHRCQEMQHESAALNRTALHGEGCSRLPPWPQQSVLGRRQRVDDGNTDTIQRQVRPCISGIDMDRSNCNNYASNRASQQRPSRARGLATNFGGLFRTHSFDSFTTPSHPSQLGEFQRLLYSISTPSQRTPVLQRASSTPHLLGANDHQAQYVMDSLEAYLMQTDTDSDQGAVNVPGDDTYIPAAQLDQAAPVARQVQSQSTFTKQCTYCGARLMNCELNGVCCSQGKKAIQIMPYYPPALKTIFTQPGFSQFSRMCNNQFCMTAIGVYNKEGGGFQQMSGEYNISFKGRIYHRALPIDQPGPLHWMVVDPDSMPNAQFTARQLHWVQCIREYLYNHNQYCQQFRALADGQTQGQAVDVVFKENTMDPNGCGELVVIYRNEDDNLAPPMRHAVRFPRYGGSNDGEFVSVHSCHYEPLQFPLLFPHASPGWFTTDPSSTHSRRPLAMPSPDGMSRELTLQEYMKQLQYRGEQFHDCGWLFNEFLCDGMSRIEDIRLNYVRNNVNNRVATAAELIDYDTNMQRAAITDRAALAAQPVPLHQPNNAPIAASRTQIAAPQSASSRPPPLPPVPADAIAHVHQGTVGGTDAHVQRVPAPAGRQCLPKSFAGGPRYQRALMQDGLAIVREYGSPGFFVTMTCNPQWEEIQRELKNGQRAKDRPDLVNRVFRAKLEELLSDLKLGKVFVMPGRRRGQDKLRYWMCVTEFQVRGLPHAHIVVMYHGPQPVTAENVDACVCAEMPDEQSSDPEQRLLASLVKRFMRHTCSSKCKNEQGVCRRGYPKLQQECTTFEGNGYPVYRRRCSADNATRDARVVPYNSYLLLKFKCHINVEVAASVQLVAYLYKYIYKGPDVAFFRFRRTEEDEQLDEVDIYVSCRIMGASEASWRTLGYHINRLFPSVERLKVHLPGQMQVYYNPEQQVALDAIQASRCPIELYFQRPRLGVEIEGMTYLQFYATFRNAASAREEPRWVRRQKRHISRIHNTVTPRAGELFYLQQLLKHVPSRSWEQLRYYNGVQYRTYREAAIARALVVEDNEAELCMRTAVQELLCSPPQLISLFVQLVRDGAPADILYNKFSRQLGLQYHFSAGGGIEDEFSPATTNQLLRELFERLRRVGVDPLTTGLQEPDNDSNELLRMRERMHDVYEDDRAAVDDHVPLLTAEQRAIYDRAIDAVRSATPLALFIDAPSGRGKSFLLSAIGSTVRSTGHIALTCASTGIASLDYFEGVTAHSLFKIPINRDSGRHQYSADKVCGVSANSQRADMIREAAIIMWDEVAMAHRKDFEAVDRLLRDLTQRHTVPFGGKVFLCAGDFRQIAPVVKFARRAETVAASLKSSVLFAQLKRMKLTVPMRDAGDPLWSATVDQVGNGVGSTNRPDGAYEIMLPDTVRRFKGVGEALQWVQQGAQAERLPYCSMLSFTNGAVDEINAFALDMHLGESICLRGYTQMVDNDIHDAMEELLDGATGENAPPSCIYVKPGMVAMILRNLDPTVKLMNGSKVRILSVHNQRLVRVHVYATGQEAIIPRINFVFTPVGTQFEVKRTQFPLRLATATTTNKSQGQTLDRVVLDLRSQAFSHGQLYVAIGRVKRAVDIGVLLPQAQFDELQSIEGGRPVAVNVVYRELLQ